MHHRTGAPIAYIRHNPGTDPGHRHDHANAAHPSWLAWSWWDDQRPKSWPSSGDDLVGTDEKEATHATNSFRASGFTCCLYGRNPARAQTINKGGRGLFHRSTCPELERHPDSPTSRIDIDHGKRHNEMPNPEKRTLYAQETACAQVRACVHVSRLRGIR